MNGHFICGRAYKGRFEAVKRIFKRYVSGEPAFFFFKMVRRTWYELGFTYEKGAAK